MALANAYKGLGDMRMQQEELRKLIQSLPFSHIRDVCNLINGLDLRFEILGNLPRELSDKILEHLSLYQCFQARRVSQRWKEIFSTDHIIGKKLVLDARITKIITESVFLDDPGLWMLTYVAIPLV